ncbi:PTS galactitol transporter subunit IIA [Vibrio sp. HA2012]|uniref:PTS galactitol transporter subunit IIA n=1 Tax=Vibrio sp. HA2012 TaxID=1971595 RepID=UPI000C2B63B9|nr:PTS galactitol transporter subunit IIA [Vibrio sp. HA2012]PJC86790.1 PTS galactitol transporter subunit IIA [Vibrio sp. HA2012]
MIETQLFVDTGLDFKTSTDALTHIGNFLSSMDYVKASYLKAIFEREESFPTGIDLGFGAVAIPHCDASHANKPCIYVIKPDQPVPFNRADDDGEVEAKVIIALVVTDPQQQLKLLKALFSSLQDEEFFNALANSESKSEISDIFNNRILNTEKEVA